MTIQIIAQEVISQELYGKTCDELSTNERKKVKQEWIKRLWERENIHLPR